jgi:hypothetical protein
MMSKVETLNAWADLLRNNPENVAPAWQRRFNLIASQAKSNFSSYSLLVTKLQLGNAVLEAPASRLWTTVKSPANKKIWPTHQK